MSTSPAARHHRRHAPRARRAAAAVGVVREFVFVLDLFLLAAAVAVFVLSGLTPLDSPVITIVVLVALAGAAAHQAWHARREAPPEDERRHREDRERRGF